MPISVDKKGLSRIDCCRSGFFYARAIILHPLPKENKMTGNRKESQFSIESTTTGREHAPLLVAEGLHVLNQQVYEAVTGQDGDSLRRLALNHMRSGAQALAVNLGQGKMMTRLTPWVIASLAEWMEAPLFISANILDHVPTLRSFGKRIVVNAVTAEASSLSRTMQAVKQYDAGLVVLLVKPGLTPSGVHDRLALAAEVLDLAYRVGLPFSRLYLDPVLGCRPDPVAWNISRGFPDVGPAAETIGLIRELDGDVGTIVGLGTSTQGLKGEKRDRIQLSMLALLTAAGLDAVILNCLGGTLMTTLGKGRCRDAADEKVRREMVGRAA